MIHRSIANRFLPRDSYVMPSIQWDLAKCLWDYWDCKARSRQDPEILATIAGTATVQLCDQPATKPDNAQHSWARLCRFDWRPSGEEALVLPLVHRPPVKEHQYHSNALLPATSHHCFQVVAAMPVWGCPIPARRLDLCRWKDRAIPQAQYRITWMLL